MSIIKQTIPKSGQPVKITRLYETDNNSKLNFYKNKNVDGGSSESQDDFVEKLEASKKTLLDLEIQKQKIQKLIAFKNDKMREKKNNSTM